MELEAYAIVFSCQKLRQFLLTKKFDLITDQQGIAYLLSRPQSNVKNAKLSRWRLDLSEFRYSIQYRMGQQNVVADALSRVGALSLDSSDQPVFVPPEARETLIAGVHDHMGHPGQFRTLTFIRQFYIWPGIDKDVANFIKDLRHRKASLLPPSCGTSYSRKASLGTHFHRFCGAEIFAKGEAMDINSCRRVLAFSFRFRSCRHDPSDGSRVLGKPFHHFRASRMRSF